MSDDSSTANPEAEVPVLDGVWLRRERERIAIGRRQVAERLGLPESQVSRVEMNKRLVPSEWFAALAELGFPVPSNLLVMDALKSAPQVPDVYAPTSAALSSAEDPFDRTVEGGLGLLESAPAEILMQPVETDLPSEQPVPGVLPEPVPRPDLVPAPTPEPKAAAEPSPAIDAPTAPSDVPSPAMQAAEPAETSLSPPTTSPVAAHSSGELLRGKWLQEQRRARDVSMRQLSEALATSKFSLRRLEANDMPLPSRWLPKLVALELIDGKSDRMKLQPTAPRYTGRWLRRERKGRGMTYIAIAPALRVAPSLLEVTERHNWPLPPEWLPALRTLGLTRSAAALSVDTARTLQKPTREKPPRKSAAASKEPQRRAARTTSAPPDKTQDPSLGKPLSGAWLRPLRLKKQITQRELSQRLQTNPSELCRYEMKDRPLRPEWLPILQKLGFPVPTTPHENLQTPKRAAAAVAAKPVALMSARALDPAPRIDGRWLNAERDRLGLSRRAVQLGLRVSWETYLRFEKPRVLLPRSWWPALRQLGMRLPTALPTPTAPPTPRTGPLDGAWLAKERKRLRLTEYDACRALQVNARMLRRIEREADALAKAWFPALRALGLAVDVAPGLKDSANKVAGTAPAPAEPTGSPKPGKAIVAPPAPAPTTSSAAQVTSPKPPVRDAADCDLAMLIVTYRLNLGRRSQQPPMETLSRILADLRESGAERHVTHDDVEQAVKGLLRTHRT